MNIKYRKNDTWRALIIPLKEDLVGDITYFIESSIINMLSEDDKDDFNHNHCHIDIVDFNIVPGENTFLQVNFAIVKGE